MYVYTYIQYAYILYIHIAIYIIYIIICLHIMGIMNYNCNMYMYTQHVQWKMVVLYVCTYVRKYVYCLICHHWSMDG